MTNCDGNSETCQDDIIVVLITNVVFISCTKTKLIYAIEQMTILDLVVLGRNPRHPAAFQGIWLHSKANRQGRLRARIAQYIKTPSETKVVGNSFYIVFSILISKTTTLTYEIKHMDPLTETLLLSIITNIIFPYITQKM
jgi:hypothetical protein